MRNAKVAESAIKYHFGMNQKSAAQELLFISSQKHFSMIHIHAYNTLFKENHA